MTVKAQATQQDKRQWGIQPFAYESGFMWRKHFSVIRLLVVSTTAFLLLEMFWALWQSAGITRGAVTPHSCCIKFLYLSAVFSDTHSLEFLVGRSGRLLTFSVPCWAPYDLVLPVTGEFTKSDWECHRWQAPTAGYFRRNLNTPLNLLAFMLKAKRGVLAASFSICLPHGSLLSLPGLPALLGSGPHSALPPLLENTCLCAGSRFCPWNSSS